MTTQTILVTLIGIECSQSGCGVTFGLEESYYRARKRDHQTFYCSNGHARYYPNESDIERANRLLQYERDRSAALVSERDGAQASLRTTKGHVTRLRKVVASGACPYGCGRRFAGLAEHIAKVHPDQPLEAEQ